MKPLLGVGWQLSELHGWGVFGINLVRELLRMGAPMPVLLQDPVLSPQAERELATQVAAWQQLKSNLQAGGPDRRVVLKDALVIHGFGNRFSGTGRNPRVRGESNAAFIFFEETVFSEEDLAYAKTMDRVLAGSSWNARLLQSVGFADARCVMQGVDLGRFAGERKKSRYPDRFVVFSGGKAEYRKAQDIVLHAFRLFHQRHPDALLLTAWHNPWPATAASLAQGPHGVGAPSVAAGGSLDIRGWAARNGLPKQAFVDVGLVNNAELPGIYAEADVALFPNRAEGGTNLVAMELMASAVPCVLSANTGQLDLIGDAHCYPLRRQRPTGRPGEAGWGESDVEEILEQLEAAYADRDEAARRGRLGRAFISQYAWANQVRALVDAVADL